MAPGPHDQVPHRLIITLCTVGATLLQALDQTIANVALPYMQGSLSASFDEITWVLTSYITAAAIMTAPVGWMASRFGRKHLFIGCLIGFTITSMLCGAAQSLNQMVLFRLFQGMFGAALVPLSQATMLDIYPAEQRGNAMAIWGVGVMIGPILGPTLGGYLTEMYNWRFVFYINLPFGILATLGLIFFMPRAEPRSGMRFDWTGFAVLSLGIGGIQMMLDRGQDQDWFSAREIIVEAVLGGLGVYLFVVHMLTARRPFIPPALFKDRNFATGVGMMFAAGTILVSSSSLMAPWLQNLANYPVEQAGLIMAPRGIGKMLSMVHAGGLRAFHPQLAWLQHRVVWSWSDDLDARHRHAAAGHHHHSAGLRAGLPVHTAADGRVRHPAGDAAHRRRLAVQPGAQHRRGDRCVRHLVDAGAQHPDAARRDRRVGQSVQSCAAGWCGGAATSRSGDPPWRGDARPDDQPSGADHRLRGRLQDDDLHHAAGAVAAVPDAATAPAAARCGVECGDGVS
jgi:multidrug resistance protein